MIGSYLDESFDSSKKGIFAVGGLLGRGIPIFEIDRKWEQLRRSSGIKIDYFKASECEHGSEQFAKFVTKPKAVTPTERKKLDVIWERFLNILIGEAAVVYGIGVIQDDFYEVIKDPTAKSILGPSPYWFAYQSAMIEAAFAMKKVGQGDKVAFVCDEDEEHSEIAPDVYEELKKKNPNAAKHMGSFTMKADHECESLQAADAVIYEIRRSLHYSLGRWKRRLQSGNSLRWQFRKLADKKRIWLIQYADRRYLEDVVKENTPGKPLDLDHFMEQEFDKDIQF